MDILESEFKLSGHALAHYQSWESGFDGYDAGLARDLFKGRALQGWDASQKVSELRKKYPKASLVDRRIRVQFASV